MFPRLIIPEIVTKLSLSSSMMNATSLFGGLLMLFRVVDSDGRDSYSSGSRSAGDTYPPMVMTAVSSRALFDELYLII